MFALHHTAAERSNTKDYRVPILDSPFGKVKVRRTKSGPYYHCVALFRTFSAAIQGIDAHVVDVEVDMYPAGTQRDVVTVGMPDAAVKESRERIKSALLNSGFGYPSKSVTINLAPANLRKEGAGFDLPMAMALLGAMGLFGSMEDYMVVGELSLDGSLRPIRGALSIAVCAAPRRFNFSTSLPRLAPPCPAFPTRPKPTRIFQTSAMCAGKRWRSARLK